MTRGADAEDLTAVISLDEAQKMIAIARSAHVDDTIHDYVVRIVSATRGLDQLRLGSSMRGALALIRAARALAVAQGRPFVTVDDIKVLAPAALGHRLLLTPDAELRGVRSSRPGRGRHRPHRAAGADPPPRGQLVRTARS